MKTRSEMIKLRIFLAYAGIKGRLREMECPRLGSQGWLDRVSFIYGQYRRNMVSFKNRLPRGILLSPPVRPSVRLAMISAAPRLYLYDLSFSFPLALDGEFSSRRLPLNL